MELQSKEVLARVRFSVQGGGCYSRPSGHRQGPGQVAKGGVAGGQGMNVGPLCPSRSCHCSTPSLVTQGPCAHGLDPPGLASCLVRCAASSRRRHQPHLVTPRCPSRPPWPCGPSAAGKQIGLITICGCVFSQNLRKSHLQPDGEKVRVTPIITSELVGQQALCLLSGDRRRHGPSVLPWCTTPCPSWSALIW